MTRTGRRLNDVDIHVGSRVRLRRTLKSMSQLELGRTLGVTFQQVQKYEKGANRISAGRLYKISEALDIPVSFFFDDLPGNKKAKDPNADLVNLIGGKDVNMMRDYVKLTSAQKAAVHTLVKMLPVKDSPSRIEQTKTYPAGEKP